MATVQPRRVRSDMRPRRTLHRFAGESPAYFVIEALRISSVGRWTGKHYEWMQAQAVAAP